MTKEFNCDKCVLSKTCEYQTDANEALYKMETREDNIYNPGIFGYSMMCYNYHIEEDFGY